MAKKLSQLEKAIADVDGQIAVLNHARQILVKQQAAAPKRKAKTLDRQQQERFASVADGR